jgi:hypothetical protein
LIWRRPRIEVLRDDRRFGDVELDRLALGLSDVNRPGR